MQQTRNTNLPIKAKKEKMNNPRTNVKNQKFCSNTLERQYRSSYLNECLRRQGLTCLRSITNLSFFPSSTDKGLTQYGGSQCSWMQSFNNNLEIASSTNWGCRTAERLFLKWHLSGNLTNANLYPSEIRPKTNCGHKWWIPNNWYTVSVDLLHRRNLQQTLARFLNNHQSKGTHRFRQHPHRHPKLTIPDRLVMPGWADGPTKRRLRSSWDNYELNDQIPNTETKKGKGHEQWNKMKQRW